MLSNVTLKVISFLRMAFQKYCATPKVGNNLANMLISIKY